MSTIERHAPTAGIKSRTAFSGNVICLFNVKHHIYEYHLSQLHTTVEYRNYMKGNDSFSR